MLRRFTTAERHFSRGQQLAAQHQYDAAVEAFGSALALRPRSVGMALHQALALAETAQGVAAIALLQEAMTWQPEHPVLPLFLGQLCFDAADYGQAKRWCLHTLTLTPHNPYALGLQALVDMALGHIPAGYACLQQPPPWPMTVAERTALRLSKSRSPSVVQLANTALKCRLLLWAETYLLQQEVPVQTLSQQLVELSSSALSTKILLLIDRLCTRSVLGIQRLALHLRYLGQPATKTHQLRQVDAAEAYYLGDAATARQRYARLLSDMPEHDLARQRLYEVCYEQGDFHAAFDYLHPLVKDDTQRTAGLAAVMGELLYLVGRYAEAEMALQDAASRGLQDWKLFYYLGMCQVRQGARQQARRWFAAAVQRLNPGIIELRLDEMYRVYTHALPQQPACPAQ
jgi:tetratricopeptide (TPR) repeat protein